MLRKATVTLLFAALAALAATADAAVYRVTKTDDTDDGACTADDCSLREAILAANASPGPDTITLPTGVYALTLHGAGEDACATGDLDVTDTLDITGAHSSTTIVDGDGADRVFDVHAAFLALSGVTVRNGSGVADGGGLRAVNTASELRLFQSAVTGNRATNMGGGIASEGTLALDSVVVSANDGGAYGGGLAVGGPSTLRDVTVTANHAVYGGGGVFVRSLSTLTFDRGTVSANTSQYGGGLHSDQGACALTNTTFDGNTATASDGGAILASGGTMSVAYSTFSGNGAPQGGRSLAAQSATVTVQGSLLSTADGSPNCSGSVVSRGGNLDSGTSCGFAGAGDLQATEPLLGPLQSNGGATPTRALLRGSPAVDAAGPGCPATDQRGVARPQGPACDIGAYEADGSEPAAALPLTVPVVAHLFGLTTPWRSDLSISNPSSSPLSLSLTYYPGSGSPLSRTVTLPPQGTGLLEDVVSGTMGAGDGRGPLVIAPPATGPVPVVMSRTFAVSGAERLGQNVPAGLALPAGTYYLPGLRNDDAYRSNIAIASGSAPVTATFALFRGADGMVASGVGRTVDAAHQQTQWKLGDLFPGLARDGVPMTVRVEISAPAFPYASVVDQTSSDAVTITAQTPASEWIVPVVAGNSGSDTTFWRSDASLANPGAMAATVTLELLRAGRDNSAGDLTAAPVTLEAGATATIADVERTAFGVTGVKGTLRVVSTEPVVLTSRTYTSREDGGTYGLGVPPVAPGALTPAARMITGVRDNTPYRTNIGLLAGADGGSAALMLFDGDGTIMATATVDLLPLSLVQESLTSLFPGVPAPFPAGSVVITALEPYIAYVSVVDGSSQDPVYEVPPTITP